jgi:LuxR family quorum-sensing system transcriptional regulator CciR
VSIDDFVQTSLSATSPEELNAAFAKAISALGFEHYACTFLQLGSKTEDPVSVAVAVRYPEDWVSHYVDEGYGDVDPIMPRAAATATPYAWSQLTDLSTRQKHMFDEAAEAGLRDGICVPIHGPFGEVFVMSMATSFGDVDMRRARSQLYLLAAQYRLAVLEMAGGSAAPPPVHLSDRERECLTWSARGKSSWDIGMILGISEFTTNFHIRNACTKLQASNRILGITKAIRLGLIDP